MKKVKPVLVQYETDFFQIIVVSAILVHYSYLRMAYTLSSKTKGTLKENAFQGNKNI